MDHPRRRNLRAPGHLFVAALSVLPLAGVTVGYFHITDCSRRARAMVPVASTPEGSRRCSTLPYSATRLRHSNLLLSSIA
jgi:hypothetical protein